MKKTDNRIDKLKQFITGIIFMTLGTTLMFMFSYFLNNITIKFGGLFTVVTGSLTYLCFAVASQYLDGD